MRHRPAVGYLRVTGVWLAMLVCSRIFAARREKPLDRFLRLLTTEGGGNGRNHIPWQPGADQR